MQNNNRSYDLEERTAKFGENIINLAKNVTKNTVTLPLIGQIIRSGTSIGANYCEANGASSRKDFRNKIYICKKEAKETKYWLRLLKSAMNDLQEECNSLTKEAHELVLIFAKIAKNTE